MGSRVWLELGERALKQTRVEASSPQSPSQLVGLQNHKVVRVGRALKDHPVAPPWRGQEHSSHGAGLLWKVSQRGDNRSVPVQELGGPSQHSRVEEAGEAGCGHSLGSGSGLLIHSTEHSLVSLSQNDPSKKENFTKNTAKALEGNCEGVDLGVSCRAQHSVSQCEESLAALGQGLQGVSGARGGTSPR